MPYETKREREAAERGRDSVNRGENPNTANPYHSGRMREWFAFEDARRDAEREQDAGEGRK